jgi:hypothetical protein
MKKDDFREFLPVLNAIFPIYPGLFPSPKLRVESNTQDVDKTMVTTKTKGKDNEQQNTQTSATSRNWHGTGSGRGRKPGQPRLC